MATTGYAAAIDSGDLIMSYTPESAWGTLPSAVFKSIRLDSESFSATKTRMRPNEINPDAQASAAITTKQEAAGTLNFSVSAGTHNDLIAASIGGAFSTPVNMSGSTFACVSDGITDSGNGFVTAGVQVGQWLKVSGFTGDTLNNTFYQVLTVVAGKITTSPAPHGVDAAGETVTIKGSMVRNANVFQSFYFQKNLATSLYLRYPGCWPTGGSIDVGVGDYMKGMLSFLVKNEVTSTTEAGTSPPSAAPTGNVIESIGGIGGVTRNGAAFDAIIQKIGLKWNREGARSQFGIGSSAAMGIGKGKLVINGSLTSYFKDFSLYNEFVAETGGPITFRALDNLGKGYIYTICNATIMNPKVVAGGPGQDLMADFEMEGNPGDATLYGGKTIQIDYFA